MKSNKYDKILYQFVSDDELRPVLQTPCLNGDYIIATNGRIGIKIPKNLTKNYYKTIKGYPDLQAVIDNLLLKYSCNSYIKLSEINKVFESFKKVDDFGNCDVCNGKGIHKCSCGDVHNCWECNGTGEGKFKIGTRFDYEEKIKIGKCYFMAKTFNILLQVFKTANQNNIDVLSNAKETASIFKLDNGIELVICPNRRDKDEPHYKSLKLHNK